MGGAIHINFPEDVTSRGTCAWEAYMVYSRYDHLPWAEFHGREQQLLREIRRHSWPVEAFAAVFCAVVLQSFFGEFWLSATISAVVALSTYLGYSLWWTPKSLRELYAEQSRRLEDMYFELLRRMLNKLEFINLYGRIYPVPTIVRP